MSADLSAVPIDKQLHGVILLVLRKRVKPFPKKSWKKALLINFNYGAIPTVGKLYAELEPAFAVSDTCDLI